LGTAGNRASNLNDPLAGVVIPPPMR